MEGACFVEFDVQMTADGVAVLHHDADLVRTAGRPERIADLEWPRLARFAVGESARLGDRFSAVRVPTLASIAELLGRFPRAQGFVEVKPECLARFGIDRVLGRVLDDLAPVESRCVLVSYETDLLERARDVHPGRVGMVLREWSETSRQEVARVEPDYVFSNIQRIPAETDLWPGPWRWVVYEIVEPRLALRWAARGADLIETMSIGEMLADPVLGKERCRG